MQLIPNGPDIPNHLLQAHEDGKLVFFCGAGISCQAELPLFGNLVEKIFIETGVDYPYKDNKKIPLDIQLNLLEQKIPSLKMREALIKILNPNLKAPGAKDTHRALLQLGRNRLGDLRLITTNFDRIFNLVAAEEKIKLKYYSAPLLPVPKISNWDGLIFLHGLLPETLDEISLNRLVLTSSDFGLAYLTERWASRFLTDLFKNYEVCFIGYSLEDPVLRYIVDALAADRRHGESTPTTWAFVSSASGNSQEWQAKGVNPIIYNANNGDHSKLHKTIHKWAEIYRDGITRKESIITTYAGIYPSACTPQDDFIGRMLWAISDSSGLPAKKFAEFEPLPPLEWLLDIFSKNYFKKNDLPQFRIENVNKFSENFEFSLISRPIPPQEAPFIQLISNKGSGTFFDKIMFHLGRWLIRHLDDPRLLFWIIENGGILNKTFKMQIATELDNIENQETNEQSDPDKNHNKLLISLWHLLLDNKIYLSKCDFDIESNCDIFSWKKEFTKQGINRRLKFNLREILSPKVKITTNRFFRDQINKETWNSYTSIDIVLSGNVHSNDFQKLNKNPNWRKLLPILLNDLQSLLLDSLEIMSEIKNIDDSLDLSHFHMPSISPHWQNRNFYNWTCLIELLRDSWLEILKINRARAEQIAIFWFNIPYLTFKRLALFAASQNNAVQSKNWCEWLLDNNSKYLWLPYTKREVMRLLATQSQNLSRSERYKLVSSILSGPGNDKKDAISDVDNHEIWLRLKKMELSGATLSKKASKKLEYLSSKYSYFSLHQHEMEEFSSWISATGDPDYSIDQKTLHIPHKRSEIVEWLRNNQDQNGRFIFDDWSDVCRTEMLECMHALSELAKEEIYPFDYWNRAIQTWSEDSLILSSSEYLFKILEKANDSLFSATSKSISLWIFALSKLNLKSQNQLIKLIERVLDSLKENDLEDNAKFSLYEASNQPIGTITLAIFNIFDNRKLNDDDKLSSDLVKLFNILLNTEYHYFRYARFICAMNAIYLYRIDKEWTRSKLLPLFNWNNNKIEAKCLWKGFLRSPRIFQPLLFEIKDSFFMTLDFYSELEECSTLFSRFLTFVAIERLENFTDDEFKRAINSLPTEGINESATAMSMFLLENEDNYREYLTNRILPFWKKIWPKELTYYSEVVINALITICIRSKDEFPTALNAFIEYLRPINNLNRITKELLESKLCSQFPEHSLSFLYKIINDSSNVPSDLKNCLNQIKSASPEMSSDIKFLNLNHICSHQQ